MQRSQERTPKWTYRPLIGSKTYQPASYGSRAYRRDYRKKFFRAVHRGLTSEAPANDGHGLSLLDPRRIGNGFRQRWRQHLRHDFALRQMQHRLVQREPRDRRRMQLVRLCAASSDHHLRVRLQEHTQGDAISRSKQSVLPGDSGKSLERALSQVAILGVVAVRVQAQQSDRSRRVSSGRGRILHGLAASRERAQNHTDGHLWSGGDITDASCTWPL